MQEQNKKNRSISAPAYLVLGFLGVILVGGLLLALPFSVKEGQSVSLLDALFTSTSAVCVTGLIVVDTFDTYTLFGQIIIMILIQIGGLGFSTVAILLLLAVGRKIDFKGKFYLMEGLNFSNMQNIIQIVKKIFRYTLLCEGVGAILSIIAFSKYFSIIDSVIIGVFHSVSSFNNAGFDLLGSYKSLIDYNADLLLNLTTMVLIVTGGLGYYVIRDIKTKKSFQKLSIHSKICLTMTVGLILGGGIILLLVEDYSVLESFFMSVSTRTAGFTTVDLAATNQIALVIMSLLMFIGASPSSTGGGVKTTTIFICFAAILSGFKNRETQAFKRTVMFETVLKAFTLVFIAFSAVFLSTIVISIVEGLDFIVVLFETISAFATVGLSTGITPNLSWFSQLILMSLMFLGRLGPITIGYLWIHNVKPGYKFANEKVLIG